MCQLLGMNCNVPTDVTFSFTGFAQRGGKTDHQFGARRMGGQGRQNVGVLHQLD